MVNLPKEEFPKDIPFPILVRKISAERMHEMHDRMDYIILGKGTVYLTNLIEAADLVVHNAKMLQIPNLYQETLNFLRTESNMEFLMICDRCESICEIHYQDNVTAPER